MRQSQKVHIPSDKRLYPAGLYEQLYLRNYSSQGYQTYGQYALKYAYPVSIISRLAENPTTKAKQ